jgi:hypothetical protein
MLSINVYADVTAKVDRNQIVIGETFNLVISTDENTNDQPDLTELNDVFRVLGTSQSSSTKIINGEYSVEKSWQISLMPNGIGKNTIPPIKLGNKQTKPIQVEVRKSDPNAKANGDLFIEVSTDKKSAFVKEQIILTVKLFYSIALSEGNLSEPIASNTIVTQLDKGATYSTNRDGKNYTVVERHYALFAEKSGQLEMNPIIFNGRDNSSKRNFSMFSTGKPVRALSKSIELDIKPIPQGSIGKDWIPAKRVSISQEWSKGPYTVGEPITRTITLYVEGLSETQIPDIKLGEIDNIRTYPEQPQTQTEKAADTLKAWKQMKIALIPTDAGAIRIPEFQLEWYNTTTQKIEQAKLPPITLQVDAGQFMLDKPEMGNVLNNGNNQQAGTALNSESPQEKAIQVIEKDNSVWKILSALFALLWLVTTLMFLKSRSRKINNIETQKEIKISKMQIIKAINNSDIKELQSDLIFWWNQQNPATQVTNLSQIKPWVNTQMQNLLDQLEWQLYNADKKGTFDQKQWLTAINGKGLTIIKRTNKAEKSDLPELY